ncbi:MAG TPA: PIN domain nuclease [Terriglobales bacterium]|nr:PIN domain nuclease [Terriglobales bacterium]
MVIIDTTVWIDYLRATDTLETRWLDQHLTQERLGLTDLILCEVLQGIRSANSFAAVRDELLQFHVFETGGIDLAIAAARNYRNLREQGHTVRKTIDCLIATFCIEAGHALLHRDRDFDIFENQLGLSVIRP